MNERTFLLVHSLIFLVFFVVGVLALSLPQGTYARAIGRFWPAAIPAKKGLGLQRRLVGLVLALMGLFGLMPDIARVNHPKLGARAPWIANGGFQGTNPSWLPLVLGLLVVAGGFFVAMNPGPVVQWSQRRLFPERQLSEGTLRTCRLVLRAAGVLMVYSSLGLFEIWLRR